MTDDTANATADDPLPRTGPVEAFDEGWFDPAASTFGDRVTGAREAAGMTQKQLAKRLGIRLSTLQGWENDLSEPRANKLQMLAGLLNVSLAWLLEGVGDGIPAPSDEAPLGNDIKDILAEIRALKTRANKTANRLGALEKKLAAVAREYDLA
ncbi:MAG: helix-turn-helix transcriptional regulator [Paracoccaceae bacterium]